jgi:tetratricopeptide (TPR) repeat protein
MRLWCCIALVTGTIAWAAPQRDEVLKHFDRGRDLFEEHDDSGEAANEAEAEFRRALALDPRFSPAIAYLGFLAADRQKPQEAEAAYRRALEIDSHCAEARVGMARLNLQAGRRAEGLRKLRQAVADQPKNVLALSELAFTLTSEPARPTPETWDEAIGYLETLVAMDANLRDAHHGLAQAYEHRGRWADAERHYREVLRIGQIDEDSDVWVYSVHANVAQMLERQGKFQEAIREYEALIASEVAGEGEIDDAKARIAVLKKRP